MEIKLFEVRDVMTRLAVMAIRLRPDNEQQRALLASAGYGRSGLDQMQYVIMMDLGDCRGHYDPHSQGSHTRRVVHEYLLTDAWANLKDGDVLDVEVIRGKKSTPKDSEVQGTY